MDELTRAYSQLNINTNVIEEDTSGRTCQNYNNGNLEISKLGTIPEYSIAPTSYANTPSSCTDQDCNIQCSQQTYKDITGVVSSAVQNKIPIETLGLMDNNFPELDKIVAVRKTQIQSGLSEKSVDGIDISEEKPTCSIYTKQSKYNHLQEMPHSDGTRNVLTASETSPLHISSTGDGDGPGPEPITIRNRSGTNSLRRNSTSKACANYSEIFYGFVTLFKMDRRFKKWKTICKGILKIVEDPCNKMRKLIMRNPNTMVIVVNHRIDQGVIFKNIDTNDKRIVWSALNYVNNTFGLRDMLGIEFHSSYAHKRFKQCIRTIFKEIDEEDSD
ncbi:uncharacterized protein LOC119682489 [Teleopsis dalmanni]|uniref:uncharacterized protein LOC119682489 n=1 Tax=Teleopsis dalmanni TaxID=139649 RepID=UPI0018CEF694|nr:uncharacterized protein LOC119682489 [Teleopsis dalmanni]